MTRERISTTVDSDLLASARGLVARRDSALFDEALAALVAAHRSAEIDGAYEAYDAHPADEPDDWGDLASFHAAAAAT